MLYLSCPYTCNQCLDFLGDLPRQHFIFSSEYSQIASNTLMNSCALLSLIQCLLWPVARCCKVTLPLDGGLL